MYRKLVWTEYRRSAPPLSKAPALSARHSSRPPRELIPSLQSVQRLINGLDCSFLTRSG